MVCEDDAVKLCVAVVAELVAHCRSDSHTHEVFAVFAVPGL